MTGATYLVGTFHLDLKGEERLYNALKSLNPDAITVEYMPEHEITPRALNDYTRLIMTALRDHGGKGSEIAEVARLTRAVMRTEGFENRAAKRYSEEFDVPSHKVGSPEELENASDSLFSQKEREIFFSNLILGARSRDNFQRYIDDRYAKNRAAYDTGMPADDEDAALRCGLIGQRDHTMSSDIRRFSNQSSGRVVNIGGADHFLDSPDGNTVYSQMTDMSPERLLINEFEPLEVSA